MTERTSSQVANAEETSALAEQLEVLAEEQRLKVSAPKLPPKSGKTVTSEVAIRLPRQGAEQTRQDLLEAGALLVNSLVLGKQPFSAINLLPFLEIDLVLHDASAIAKERLQGRKKARKEDRVAPLSSGAFYKALSDLSDCGSGDTKGYILNAFRREVVKKVVNEIPVLNPRSFIDFCKEARSQGATLGQITRRTTEIGFRNWVATPARYLVAALSFYAKADPSIAEIGKELQEKEYLALAELYRALLPVFGLKMKEGLDIEDMAVVVADLVLGMAVNERFFPESHNRELNSSEGGENKWTLCSRAIWAIYESFMEPSDPEPHT